MARRIWRRQASGRVRSRDLYRRRPGEQAAVVATSSLLETTSALAITARAGQDVSVWSEAAGYAAASGGISIFDSLLDGSETPNFNGNDNTPAVLGLRFKVLTTGYLWGVRFYNPNAAARQVYLYDRHDSSSATIVAQATSSAAAGWQDVLFGAPIAVGPIGGYGGDGVYVVDYFSPIIEGFGSGQYVTIAGGARSADNGPFGHAYLENVESVFAYSSTGDSVVPGTNYSNDSYGIAPLFALTESGDGGIPPAVNAKAGGPDQSQRLGLRQTAITTVTGSAISPINLSMEASFGVQQDTALASPIGATGDDTVVLSQDAALTTLARAVAGNSLSVVQFAVCEVPAVLTASHAIDVQQACQVAIGNGVTVAQSLGVGQGATGSVPITATTTQSLGVVAVSAAAVLEQTQVAQSVGVGQVASIDLVATAAAAQGLGVFQAAPTTVEINVAAAQSVGVQQAAQFGSVVEASAAQSVGVGQEAEFRIGSGVHAVHSLGISQEAAATQSGPVVKASLSVGVQQDAVARVPIITGAVDQSLGVQQQATVERTTRLTTSQQLGVGSSGSARVSVKATASWSIGVFAVTDVVVRIVAVASGSLGLGQSLVGVAPATLVTEQSLGMSSQARIELVIGLHVDHRLGLGQQVVVSMPNEATIEQSLSVGQEVLFELHRTGLTIRLQGVILDRRPATISGSVEPRVQAIVGEATKSIELQGVRLQ